MKKFKRVYIEITNVCNLNCSFCPKHSRQPKFMTAQEFSVVAKQISPLTNIVCLHLMGEPLLNPNFEEILKICKNLGLTVYLTTNGTLIKNNLEVLIKYPCKRISVSVHSYEANTSKISLEGYLLDIFNTSKQLTSQTKTYVEFRLWNNGSLNNNLNQTILEFANKFFNTNVDTENPIKNFHFTEYIYLNFNDIFEWPINTLNSKKSEAKFCYGLQSHFGVLVDGTVVACCLDNNANLALGNIFNSPITDILNSPRATAICEGFKKNVAVEDFCKSCIYATRFDK